MVCVFLGLSGVGAAKVRFLADWGPHTHEVFANDAKGVTPLSAFGVAIDIDEATGEFRCVPAPDAKHTAMFFDGARRPWEICIGDFEWWPYRVEVLKMLDRRFVL